MPVSVPEVGEYVADGAARQAAWVLEGTDEPPNWIPRLANEYDGAYAPFILERYAEVSHLTASRSTLGMSQ
jgi:xylulokinase